MSVVGLGCVELRKLDPWPCLRGVQFYRLQFKLEWFLLPATAAIEYVAACVCPWALFSRGSFGREIFVRGCFCPGGLLPGGLLSGGFMPVPPKFNAYTHRLGFLCLES